MATRRKNVPEKIAAEVMFLADRRCCCCNDGKKQADQIHHIDGNNSNSALNNLVYLCFDCHNAAETTSKLKRKLSAAAILLFREHHYKVIAQKRARALKSLDKPIQSISTEALLTAAKNAIIIMDIVKIKDTYYEAEWQERIKIVSELFKYSDHCDIRISYEVFIFLSEIANQTRGGMPYTMANTIFDIILYFFPEGYFKSKDKQVDQIAIQCINISFNIMYDAAIHLRNLAILQEGLLMLKYFNGCFHLNKRKALITKLNTTFDELLRHLNRPERDDLNYSKELILIYRDALNNVSDSIPDLPMHLNKIILKDSNLK